MMMTSLTKGLLMTQEAWTSEEIIFFNFVEVRRGVQGRIMMERIFTHMDAELKNYYIESVMGDDTDGQTPKEPTGT